MASRSRTQQPPQVAPDAPSRASTPAASKGSGRVQFDERGHAVWEWQVQTGKFDPNANTGRVRALTDAAGKLELQDTPAASGTAAPDVPAPGDSRDHPWTTPATTDAPDCDPYSRGPARSPESVTFNPHERKPRPKR